MDGTGLRVPDTPENRKYFLGQSNHHGPSRYPQARLGALMALHSHELAAVAFGPWSIGEQTYSDELWTHLPASSLTVMDRLFFATAPPCGLLRRCSERHFLLRRRSNFYVDKRLGLGKGPDAPAEVRKQDPGLPGHSNLRLIRYQRTGFRGSTR